MENTGRYPFVCYKHEQHFIICLTAQLHLKVIQWFHKVTAHNAGITQLHNNLHFHFYHPQLTAEIQKQILSCDICQHMKCGAWQYRFLTALMPMLPLGMKLQLIVLVPG